MKTILAIVLTIAMAAMVSGCAFGVDKPKVVHDPLPTIQAKRQGTVVLRQFVDCRTTDARYIGTKRNGFGMATGHIGIKDDVKLEPLLTEYFAEALEEAGYKVIRQPADAAPDVGKADAIIEGEIRKFWLDLYMATWHEIVVLVRVRGRDGQSVLWEKEIRGNQTNVLWLGVTSEFETVVRQALNKALSQATTEFASDEFYQRILK